ncbi:SBBP repeat-containing protein [Mastigocoleus testarum]|uniref:Hemolysin n=1 Tax=Mastigocoleus testarum BC008 TaxID=371196 RepID=A0A0V7ZDD2_9CYAN|nr:SBBP repeat-containing protein [Mastigocoleus testarum]KST62481.1 hypothetical protein BC008_09945 [Mastigocoleus testarum BC008]
MNKSTELDKQLFYEQLQEEVSTTGGSIRKSIQDLFSRAPDVTSTKREPVKKLPRGFRQSEIGRVENEVTIPEFTIQVYTPGSDLAVGTAKNQLIYARDGNDTLIGFNPYDNQPNEIQIDILVGDLPIIQPPTPRNWSDRFVLGDAKQPFYSDAGFNDFGLILDFQTDQDVIQLHGSRKDYRLAESFLGTEIYYEPKKSKGKSDFIGFLPFVNDLNLRDNYFQFEGKGKKRGGKPRVKKSTQLGTIGFDLTASAAVDIRGNVYTAGYTSGSLGGTNAGGQDALLVKYDPHGKLEWIEQFGTSDVDTIYGMATDKRGNIYLTGLTGGDLAAPKQASSTDAWIAKYDGNGNRLWIDQFGTDVINQAFDIDVDNDGNVYVSGLTVKDTESEEAFASTDDYWITKYDTNGNRQWFEEFGSAENPNGFNFDESYGVAVTDDGSSVYASGWTFGNLGGENAGLYDAWVGKYDNNGNEVWLKQFGTPTYEFSWDVDTDSKGNAYAIGWTLGDLGGKNAGLYDAWLAKYDKDGNQEWIQQYGTSGDDQAFGVEVDNKGDVYVVGYTNQVSRKRNTGSFDAWVVKYDENGNQKWDKRFGAPSLDQALGVSVDNVTDSLYVTGSTGSSFGGKATGITDSWVAKLDTNSGRLQRFTDKQKRSGRKLNGTAGDDRIISTKKRDIITGGGGDDIFVYQNFRDGKDTITDFDTTDDLIDVSSIFASPKYHSTTPFDDYVQLIQKDSSTVVQINPFGDARDSFKTLVTLDNVIATELTQSNFII